MDIEKMLDEMAKVEGSGVVRRTIHLIPIHDGNGMPTGKLWQVKQPGAVYDKIIGASGGILPSHIVIIKA